MGNTVRMKAIKILFLLLMVTAVLFGFTFVSSAFAETSFVILQLNGGIIDGYEQSENGTIEFDFNESDGILPTPQKDGYEFLGWAKSDSEDDNEYVDNLIIESEIENLFLYAKYELKAPEIEVQPTDYSGIYGEGGHTLSVTAFHEGDFELSYQWYKNGKQIENATSNEWNVTNVKESGIYNVVVSVTVDGEKKEIKSKNALVRIQKAKLTTAPELIIEGVYSPDKTLSDYVLKDNFKWIDEGLIPTPNVRKYSAVFNIDSDNYFDIECSVILIISKAEQEIFAEDLIKVYDGYPVSIKATTSGDAVLEYSENNELTNVGKEIVIISAPETDFYLKKSIAVTLQVVPQSLDVIWSDFYFIYNGYEQKPSATAVDNQGLPVEIIVHGNGVDAGVYNATAYANSDNYVLENDTKEYAIGKADFNADTLIFEDKEFVYDGNPHSLEITNLPEWLSASYDKEPVEVGFYTITASFVVNNPNYNDLNPKTAKLTILQNYFKGDWYEILCPEGVNPNVTLRLELIDDLDGLSNNHNGKLKYILGFRVLSSDDTTYRKPLIIKFNYEKVTIENLVLSVDKNSNEKIITYTYENGKVVVKLDGAEQNIVFAERTQGVAWIIVLVVGICIAVSVGLYFILNKKTKSE